MKSKLIAYAIDCASFLVQKLETLGNIKNIILFGSVVREESTRTSDIDIFIDTLTKDKTTEEEIRKRLDLFFQSTKYTNYWKPLGVENEIKLTIGALEEWKELQPSILSNGIILYGKFKQEIADGKHTTFFIWENIRPNTKRVLFNKQLFGYTSNKKFYPGLLQKYKGIRLGKGCIAVPLEHAQIFQQLFKKYRMGVVIKKTIEY